MKPKLILLGGILAATNLAHATTIDFNNFAEGTQASGLYDGLFIAAWNEVRSTENPQEVRIVEAVINEGKINTFTPDVLPLGSARYLSILTGTFLEPVTDLSFELSYQDYRTVIRYQGVDSFGHGFSSESFGPMRELPDFETVSLFAPAGGYLTGFFLGSGDAKARDAYFTLDNISFRRVPEGGSAWLLMAFASGVLLCFRPKSA